MSAKDPRNLVAGLAKSHGLRLHRFLSGRVRNLADVPDVVQEVFLRMLRIPDGEAIHSPEAYLFTVALHVAQQHAMRESAAPPSVEVSALIEQLQSAADADPALLVNAEQSLRECERALARLSPKVRATFLLHRQYGLTLEQIARELNISFPMAKKYLVKALARFRQHLDAHQ